MLEKYFLKKSPTDKNRSFEKFAMSEWMEWRERERERKKNLHKHWLLCSVVLCICQMFRLPEKRVYQSQKLTSYILTAKFVPYFAHMRTYTFTHTKGATNVSNPASSPEPNELCKHLKVHSQIKTSTQNLWISSSSVIIILLIDCIV